MIGAIQIIGEKKAWTWMDEILAPCPRREVWASDISTPEGKFNPLQGELDSLSMFDRGWVLVNKTLANRASIIMANAVNELSGASV